jgi:hypothetical protein
LQGVSLDGRRVSEHLVFYHFPSIDLLYYADLAQPELRDLYELVGTLNMWVPISTPINQSMVYNLECFVLVSTFISPSHDRYRRRKRHGTRGGVDAIYLAFDYICLRDF